MPYQNAVDIWSYLHWFMMKKMRLQLGYEITEYNQGDNSIQDYYFGFMTL